MQTSPVCLRLPIIAYRYNSRVLFRMRIFRLLPGFSLLCHKLPGVLEDRFQTGLHGKKECGLLRCAAGGVEHIIVS